MSGAGDVNGGGFADLIAGAPLDDNNGVSSGSARVFSGSDGSVLYTFNGDAVQDFFGTSVSGVGDVNSDGFDDFIVGAGARTRVFSGSDGSVLYNFDGRSGSVSGAGDVNGDGFDDLIVGENGTPARVFSGSDGSLIYNLQGLSLIHI